MAVLSSVTELPRIRCEDPLTRIDWSAVDRDCWWLPPSLLSLAGVPEFERLSVRTRQLLSQLEYVHLLEAGLWFESQFMTRLAGLAQHCGDLNRRVRFLHELREEAGHSLMFMELLHRSGYGVQGNRGFGMRALDLLGRLLPMSSGAGLGNTAERSRRSGLLEAGTSPENCFFAAAQPDSGIDSCPTRQGRFSGLASEWHRESGLRRSSACRG